MSDRIRVMSDPGRARRAVPGYRPPRRSISARGLRRAVPFAVALLLVGGCGTDGPDGGGGGFGPPAPNRIECSIPQSQIFSGGVDRGQIPDLSDPALVPVGHPDAGYLLDTDRVIGLKVAGSWVAVPHNILWWHEIVHFSQPGAEIVVTYCPLTGSSLVFELGRVSRFQVSGLLFNNNLMMVDAETESLWPQMSLGARCGPRDGDSLSTVPALEMTWAAWRALHPDTEVVSAETGFDRDYTRYPYDLYEELDAPPLFPVEDPDTRRPIKERVLGIPGASEAGIAFPFLALDALGARAAIHERVDGQEVVVLWDGRARAAAAFRPLLDGQPLTFVASNGTIRDVDTDSEWSIEGRATAGALAGASLEPFSDSFVAFWFAWSTFHPGTRVWSGS